MPRRRKPEGLTVHAGAGVAGVITGQVLRKTIHGKRHMLRRPPAIAIDLLALAEAEQAGCTDVVVVDLDDGDKTYRAKITHIRSRGFALDRGHGAQVALPLHGWQVETECVALHAP